MLTKFSLLLLCISFLAFSSLASDRADPAFKSCEPPHGPTHATFLGGGSQPVINVKAPPGATIEICHKHDPKQLIATRCMRRIMAAELPSWTCPDGGDCKGGGRFTLSKHDVSGTCYTFKNLEDRPQKAIVQFLLNKH